MAKQIIRSIRKGSAQWNEEDRLQIATLLVKAGYSVRIGRQTVPGQEERKTDRQNIPLSIGRNDK